MTKTLYRYEAEILKVVDGDTIVCLVDLGFSTFSKRIIRLAGINSPEITSTDNSIKARGIAARNYLMSLVRKDGISVDFFKIYLESKSVDKYGRSIGTIYLSRATGEKSLNQQMLDSGNAIEYKTH